MSLIDKVRQLPTLSLVLLVAGKLVIGIGLGVLLVQYLIGYGWWLIILGIAISLPGAYKVLLGK